MYVLKYFLGLILILAVLWALSRLLRVKKIQLLLQFGFIVVFTLFILEICLNIYFYTESKTWLFNLDKHPNRDLFEKHPYLATSNRPNADQKSGNTSIQHNKNGLRSTYYTDEKLEKSVRILTIGGSTTYGVGVNNHEIWPYYLDSLLGPDSVVINFGVPGHSTVEHLVMASLYIGEYNPDVIIVLAGLNDLRSSHVANLKSDYSNFHEPHLIGSMGQCYLEFQPKIASLFYLTRVCQKIGLYPICDYHKAKVSGTIGNEVDAAVLNIYRKNLKKLIHMCKYYTNDILIVPQVLVDEKVKNNGLAWWIPFVPSEGLVRQLTSFNNVSKEVAFESNCVYLDSIDSHAWVENDFIDPSHFNPQANKTLALIIKEKIKAMNDGLLDSVK